MKVKMLTLVVIAILPTGLMPVNAEPAELIPDAVTLQLAHWAANLTFEQVCVGETQDWDVCLEPERLETLVGCIRAAIGGDAACLLKAVICVGFQGDDDPTLVDVDYLKIKIRGAGTPFLLQIPGAPPGGLVTNVSAKGHFLVWLSPGSNCQK